MGRRCRLRRCDVGLPPISTIRGIAPLWALMLKAAICWGPREIALARRYYHISWRRWAYRRLGSLILVLAPALSGRIMCWFLGIRSREFQAAPCRTRYFSSGTPTRTPHRPHRTRRSLPGKALQPCRMPFPPIVLPEQLTIFGDIVDATGKELWGEMSCDVMEFWWFIASSFSACLGPAITRIKEQKKERMPMLLQAR